MTEAEWFANNDSYQMLRSCRLFIRNHPRKGRLFAVACCYRIWHLLTDPRSRAVVEAAALHAEGQLSDGHLLAAEHDASLAHEEAYRAKGKIGACPEWAAQFTASLDAWFAAKNVSHYAFVSLGGLEGGQWAGPEPAAQADLLRCILGPLPFRTIPIDPTWLAWNDATIPKIAQAIYDERTFDRLPILADALEEAGCDNEDMLNHCRGPGPHVRGCWALDMLVGKS